MKVVINTCFGGFSLSKEAEAMMKARGNTTSYYDLERNDPDLIAVVEALGGLGASGPCADLRIVEIPDDVDFEIEEYDGNEHIAEKHRTWR